MRGLGRIESSTGVTKPPQKLVFLQPRPNMDLAARRRGLDGVPDEDIREMAQSVGIEPGCGNSLVDLAREPDPSGGAFLLKITRRVAEQF